MKSNNYIIAEIVFLLFIFKNILAQDTLITKNSMYVEIGGNCFFLSINYEREIISNLNARAGFGILPWVLPYAPSSKSNEIDIAGGIITIFVFTANYFIKLDQYSSHALEIGLGFDHAFKDIFNSKPSSTTFPVFALGYRYSPCGGGTVIRVTYTPIWTDDGYQRRIVSWFGISAGTRF